jgi:hypothetical protein
MSGWWCDEHDAKWIVSKQYVKKGILAVMCWHAVKGFKVFLPFFQMKSPVLVCFVGWRYQKFGYLVIQCFWSTIWTQEHLCIGSSRSFRLVKQSLGTLKVQFFPLNWEMRVPPLLASPFMKAITGMIISLCTMSPIHMTEITQPWLHMCNGLFICQLYSLPDLLEETDCKEDTPLTLPFCIICFPLTVDNSDMN